MSAPEPTAAVAGTETSEPTAAAPSDTPTTSEPKALIFRAPSTSPASTATSSSTSTASTWTAPPPTFLTGPWHVTHSTLPMWKTNRNVIITYTPLPSPPGAIDDLVEYQPLNGDKLKRVRGIDTPDPNVAVAYNWRGRGWLKIASSHWEVLGWGEEEGGWAVTFFAKTLFTPMGVEVYARAKGGLSTGLVERILGEMRRVGGGEEGGDEVGRLVGEVFEIRHD